MQSSCGLAVNEVDVDDLMASIASTEKVIQVKDLSKYKGSSIGEKVDAFIEEHKVAIIAKSSCPFCRDVLDLLGTQLGMAVHVINVDQHPEGGSIHKYIQDKYHHCNLPANFCRNHFLGGCEDVKSLHAGGKLEGQILPEKDNMEDQGRQQTTESTEDDDKREKPISETDLSKVMVPIPQARRSYLQNKEKRTRNSSKTISSSSIFQIDRSDHDACPAATKHGLRQNRDTGKAVSDEVDQPIAEGATTTKANSFTNLRRGLRRTSEELHEKLEKRRSSNNIIGGGEDISVRAENDEENPIGVAGAREGNEESVGNAALLVREMSGDEATDDEDPVDRPDEASLPPASEEETEPLDDSPVALIEAQLVSEPSFVVAHMVTEEDASRNNCGGRANKLLVLGLVAALLALGALVAVFGGFGRDSGDNRSSIEEGSASNASLVPTHIATGAPSITPTNPLSPTVAPAPTVPISSIRVFGDVYSVRNTTSLTLFSSGLAGTIPPQLGLLAALTEIDLARNILNGPIPTELGLLTSITRLYLWSNSLTGTIPSQLGQLIDLDGMSLGSNSLSGPIPTELSLPPIMTWLDLDVNRLTGSIPTLFGQLTAMSGINLWGNAFLTGIIPTELGLLPDLTHLQLYGNSHNGNIPSQFGLLTKMTQLTINGNSLTGSIPTQLGLLTAMQELGLYGNDLTGTVPEELGFLTAMSSLSLHDNGLSGTIPPSVCALTLEGRNLSSCKVSGELELAKPEDCDCL